MNTKSSFFKSVTLAALFIMLAAQLQAQQNYKLSDYVNPDYRYQSLDFNMNFNANGNAARYETVDSYLSKNHVSNVGGYFGISLNQIKNTARFQGSQMVSLYFNGAANKSVTDYNSTLAGSSSSTNKVGSLTAGFGYSSTNRFYNTRKQFLEVIPNLALDFQSGRNSYSQYPINYPFITQQQSQSNSQDFGVSIMVGKGRIENIENARLALYILNDLQKMGAVKKNLSNAQVDQLARFITRLRNKRFFDSRIQNIANITSVDSLLTAMGIREHAGAGYFMTLNDDWNYANGPLRQSGHRLAFGITPAYSHLWLKSTSDTLSNVSSGSSRSVSKTKSQQTSLDIGAYYYLEKPMSLTWQHSTRISLGFQLMKQVDEMASNPFEFADYHNSFTDPNLHVSLERIYGYYPNSRTSLALDLVVGSMYEMENQEEIGHVKSHILSVYASAALSGNYYFSPRLRLNLNAALNDHYWHTNDYIGTPTHVLGHTNNWNPSINLSLRYSIF
jgi:hypothetical protein